MASIVPGTLYSKTSPGGVPSIGYPTTDAVFISTFMTFLTGHALAKYYGLCLFKNAGVIAAAGLLWSLVAFSLTYSDSLPSRVLGDGAWATIDKLAWNNAGSSIFSPSSSTVSEYPFFNNVYPFVASSFALAALAMTILLTATTKMNFLTAVFFNTLWLIASYVPLTHWMKPFASTGRVSGWLSQTGFGTLDSTSAHSVHMNAGVAFLVLSFWMGELRTRTVVVPDYDNFFWLKFGFSGYIVAGSLAGLSSMFATPAASAGAFPWSLNFINTASVSGTFIPVEAGPKLINVLLASGAGLLTMVVIDVVFNHGQGLFKGRPSASSALTGFLAGLISVTAGAGHISPNWASFFGFFTTLVVYVSPFVLGLVGIDQGYSPFVLHFIGAAVSSALTGLFANSSYSGAIYNTSTGAPDVAHFNGSFYNNSVQLGKQCAAISVTFLLSAVATTAVYWTVYAVERLCIFPHIKSLKEGDEGEENLVALKF